MELLVIQLQLVDRFFKQLYVLFHFLYLVFVETDFFIVVLFFRLQRLLKLSNPTSGTTIPFLAFTPAIPLLQFQKTVAQLLKPVLSKLIV